MRKIIQAIYCYKRVPVVDANTGQKELATYNLWFGLPAKITYKPLA